MVLGPRIADRLAHALWRCTAPGAVGLRRRPREAAGGLRGRTRGLGVGEATETAANHGLLTARHDTGTSSTLAPMRFIPPHVGTTGLSDIGPRTITSGCTDEWGQVTAQINTYLGPQLSKKVDTVHGTVAPVAPAQVLRRCVGFDPVALPFLYLNYGLERRELCIARR